ncbi:TPA: hypothetical protein ACH3X1_012301 [Trebouxia sp. C0004]
MTTVKMHNMDVKDRDAKPVRDLEAMMMQEQKLAAAEEEAATKSVQQQQATLAAAAIALAMPAAAPSDIADIVGQLEAGPAETGAAINKDDAMQLCSVEELVDLFAEYYEADKSDCSAFLTNDKNTDGDIDFDHAAFSNPGVAPAKPTNTRAVLGDNIEKYSLDAMII